MSHQDQGSLAADGSLEEVRQTAGGVHYRIHLEGPQGPFEDIGTLAAQVSEADCVDRIEPLEDGRLAVWSSVDPRPDLAALAVSKNWKIYALEQHTPTLEEAFLRLVGREA